MGRLKLMLGFVLFFQFSEAQTPKRFSLKQAIDYAIENSYENKKAQKDVQLAKQRRWEAVSTGLPQIDGKLDYRKWLEQQVQLLPSQFAGLPPGGFVPVKFGTEQSMAGSVTLKQLIFSGSYLVALQASKTYLKIKEQVKVKTQFTIRESVVNAYGNILVAEASLKLLSKNKLNIQKMLTETKEIYKNGFVEQESVEQLEITLGTIDDNLRNAERMRLIANQLLNIALGNKDNLNIELTDTLENLTGDVDLGLMSKVFNINNVIDYQMMLNNKEVKTNLLNLEKSKYLPTLAGYLNLATNANSDDFTFLDEEQKWFKSSIIGFNLTVPIFSSFGRMAKVSQAKLELEKVIIGLDQVKQKLSLQAEASKSEYQLSLESLATAKKNLLLSERIEKKNQIKFKEGIASSFDLFQAQNQLFSQQNTYIKAMLSVIAKKATLETVLNTPIK